MINFKKIFDNSGCHYSNNDIEIIMKFLKENSIDITNAEHINDFHIEDNKEEMELWLKEVSPNDEWIAKQKYCQLEDSNDCLYFFYHPANL